MSTTTKAPTTRELAAQFQEQHDLSPNGGGLWKGTYGWVARILRTYHRARALKMLDGLAARYKNMSISSVFASAANHLRGN